MVLSNNYPLNTDRFRTEGRARPTKEPFWVIYLQFFGWFIARKHRLQEDPAKRH